MLEADRKDALVDLVEVHQLQEVDEESQAVVHGEVLPASFFARDYQVVFGLQLVTQREDKALGMLLALTDEKHPTHKRPRR